MRIAILIFTLIGTNISLFSQAKPGQTITDDGAWCWFSDPRAIYIPQNKSIIAGYVSSDGSVAVSQYFIKNDTTISSVIHPKLEFDDHDHPSFLVKPDGHILTFYTMHHNKNLYMSESTNPYDAEKWSIPVTINPNSKEDIEKFIDNRYTYANPIQLQNENNRIYLFGRWTGFKPNMSWSDDGGKTWNDAKVFICPQPFSQNNRPYVKYYSDGKSKIHIVFTDGHPRVEPTNSVYYAYYENGAFYNANGSKICSIDELPFEPKDATMVYDGKKNKARAWVYDICATKKGNPVIAYARYPEETQHLYYYTSFDGNNWNDVEIVNSGKWFPDTPEGEKEREPHYSGGMSIDRSVPNTVYLSRDVNGTFEIEKWQLRKNNTWSSSPITSKSEKNNVRPYSIQLGKNKPVVLWMVNDYYIHYTDYKTAIKMMEP